MKTNFAINKTFLVFFASFFISSCALEPQSGNTKPNTAYLSSTFGLHDIATFDSYTDNGTIHLLIGGKISAGDKKTSIRYLQSTDGGNTWSQPLTVADAAALINNRGNDIQLAAHGKHFLALWQMKGELPGMGPLVSAYSLDDGKTWMIGKNPAINGAGDQSHSDLLADKDGHFHAVWLEDPEENGYQSLRYANTSDHGINWSNPITIDDSTCSCCWNTLSISPSNELNILYRDMKPRDMALIRSSDASKTWHRISTVGEFGWQFDGCPHVGGSLAYAGNNYQPHLYSLSWTGLEGKSGLYFLTSRDNGLHWSAPHKLGKQALHGDIAVFEDYLVAIWDEMDTGGSSIYFAKSGDDGKTWSSTTKLNNPDTAATHPRLAATKIGILALWTEKTGKNPSSLAWTQINP